MPIPLDFSLDDGGRAKIEVCHGLACREAGAETVLQALEAGCGLKAGQKGPDGTVLVGRQFCFGRCAIGPNVRIGNAYFANQRPEDAAALLKNALRTS